MRMITAFALALAVAVPGLSRAAEPYGIGLEGFPYPHPVSMLTLSEAGATILPASPGFYHRPASVDDLVEFVVQRVLDRIGIRTERVHRWEGPPA